jgi:hypothetical protein
MPADQAGADPGLRDEEPSEEELAEEEEAARSEVSVADQAERDLDDPATPSRRTASGDPEPGSFDVPLRDYSKEPTDDGSTGQS